MEKRVLGRGLKALISEKQGGDKSRVLESKIGQPVTNIDIDRIKINRYQPRAEFDRESLEELATSIKKKGFIQPLLVRFAGEGYELIAGERRLRAAKLLNLREVPAVIKDASNQDLLELSLIENIQRKDLNPIDQAKAYKRLVDEFNMNQENVAEVIGKDRTTVANILRLLKLPAKIQEYVSRGTISMGHARAILGIEDKSLQIRLCNRIVKNNLSVRETERYARQVILPEKKKVRTPDPNLAAIEEELRDILGTRVKILKTKRGGKIEIEFYSDSDLQRVVTYLKSKS